MKQLFKENLYSFIRLYLLGTIANVCLFIGRLLLFCNRKRSGTKFLLSSIRYDYSPRAVSSLAREIKAKKVDFKSGLSSSTATDAESRAIILSPPRICNNRIVKGVLLISYTHTFSYFSTNKNWDKLNTLFVFVLEPSSAGYADSDVLYFAQRAEHCIIQASEIHDRALLNSLMPEIPCMDTGASDWVNHHTFKPDTAEDKLYDCVYVANLNQVKRVYRAVSCFSKLSKKLESFKAVIVCASWGGTGFDDLVQHIDSIGLSNDVEVRKGMPQEELVRLIRQSKSSILLSLKEGSNRTLFESIFTDTPVLCLKDNIGVNKSYINSHTGILAYDCELEEALFALIKNYHRYSPRKWALTNISPERSTQKLRDLLQSWYGDIVNSDLYVKVNAPEVQYFEPTLEKEVINAFLFQKLDSLSVEDLSKSLLAAFGKQ